MEDEQQMHMHLTEARRLSRPPKLKDTCDMCSTSKVRCDKMKPTCGRCERLGYQCSYSPARRMQKRRCIQCTQSSGNLAEAEAGEEEQLPDAAPTATAATDGSVATDSYTSGDGAESSFRGAFNGGSFLQHQKTQPYTSNHSSTNKTDIHTNNSGSSSSSSKKCSDFSTSEAMLPGLEYSKPIHSNSDCVTVATNILEHLNTTHDVAAASFPTTQPKTPPPTNPETSIGSSASLAIKRISTILICPCSKNLDVGLLAAAVCTALLDTYEIILRKNNNNNSAKPHAASSSSSYSQSSNTNASRATAAAGPKRASTKPMMMMHQHHRKAAERMMMMDSSDSSSAIDNNKNNNNNAADDSGRRDDNDDHNDDNNDDDCDERATIMRIRDELPMVANLVAQFTRRYSQDAEMCSRDLLQGLALSITGRLSAMIDEVTNWMARI